MKMQMQMEMEMGMRMGMEMAAENRKLKAGNSKQAIARKV